MVSVRLTQKQLGTDNKHTDQNSVTTLALLLLTQYCLADAGQRPPRQ